MAQETHSEEECQDDAPTSDDRTAELEQRCEELSARFQRAQADYQNLRRRSAADLEAGVKRTIQPLLDELLLVLDFLDLALTSPAETQDARNLLQGIEMTRAKFAQALEAAGVREIASTGIFDPALHEAVETRHEKGLEPGTIIETLRRGYTWQDQALRFARVAVAVAAEDDSRGIPKARQCSEPKEEDGQD